MGMMAVANLTAFLEGARSHQGLSASVILCAQYPRRRHLPLTSPWREYFSKEQIRDRSCATGRAMIPARAAVHLAHIPKTGGTALSLALEDRAMKDDILIGDTPRARRLKVKSVTWETFTGHCWTNGRREIADFHPDLGAQPVGSRCQLLPLAAWPKLCASRCGSGKVA